MESGELPIAPEKYNKTLESVGTKVKLPVDTRDPVVKVAKENYPATPVDDALEEVKKFRRLEQLALEVASPRTRDAIVGQHYILAEGEQPGMARAVRIQQYQEGVPLKKIGFRGILSLGRDNTDTLKSIVADSMKCYLKYGANFDLSGSDERDAIKKDRILNLKRRIFPLRNSSNLMLTKQGIKLIDPNVLGSPFLTKTLKARVMQFLLFASSAADYLILSAARFLPNKREF